ncbi:hypothetical protein HELRODRAFT_164665 [Helobdella robusta]|uniref:Uncharacterized protein n=1 Tax=Helobdella robusta TaxID=6412 RepID=T1EVP6_HELRO|nr:hypothetical protein HELRODRAFT_164665 [Helobdella robusta]ESN92593.1 hypothetical protein HELRODRAFT_164665 [Helobdella robusta]
MEELMKVQITSFLSVSVSKLLSILGNCSPTENSAIGHSESHTFIKNWLGCWPAGEHRACQMSRSSKGNALRDALIIFHKPEEVSRAVKEYQGWKLERLISVASIENDLTIRR